MLARFDRDVFGEQHTLTWCCRLSVTMQSLSAGQVLPTGLLIDEGVRQLPVPGSDVCPDRSAIRAQGHRQARPDTTLI